MKDSSEAVAQAAITAELEFEKAVEEEEVNSRLRGSDVEETVTMTNTVNDSTDKVVIAKLPVTYNDVTNELVIYEGQNAEEAVVLYCRQHVSDDVSSCIRQLLSTVLEQLEESSLKG